MGLLILSFVVLLFAVSADCVTVTTKYGVVTGSQSLLSRVRSFKGIPYASPPLGPLRWKAPVAPSPWTQPLDCTAFRNNCLQWHNNTGLAAKTSEDCLFLNVWTPGKADNLPVLVFFYGGSWSYGGTTLVLYDGERVVARRNNVVVVTVNYRLGSLG